LGVLDLDSNTPAAFTQTDVTELTSLLAQLFQTTA
jgi:GAF domain-containing protein